MNKIFTYLRNLDWILFFSIFLLLCIGLAEIYSIALSTNAVDLVYFKKQLTFVIIGLTIFFGLAFFDYHNIRSFATYLYISGIILLSSVLVFGKAVKGTKGWFDLGFFSVQPVEIAKFLLIIYLAKYFSSNSIKVNPFKHLFVSGITSFIYIGLVMMQPDFGSGMLLFVIWAAMVVLAGFKKKYIGLIGLILILIFASGWLFFFQTYQKDRILNVFKKSETSLSSGYNVNQAIIAVGSGGLIGRGIGFGSQSQLKFLPESQNDFIFAVIAEEMGFLGVCSMLALFVIFFYRMLFNARKVENDFGIYYILGVTGLIFIQMFVNIAMNIGLLPVVGISLPFLSYGGSSIVSTLIMVGIAQSIIIRSKVKY